jgi:hypothetical protein
MGYCKSHRLLTSLAWFCIHSMQVEWGSGQVRPGGHDPRVMPRHVLMHETVVVGR